MCAWLLKVAAIALLILNLCALAVIISMQRRMYALEVGTTAIAKFQSEIASDLQRLTDHVWTDMCIDASRIETYQLVKSRLEVLNEQSKTIEETKKLCGRCANDY
jgi:hypothetical protein